MVWTFGPNKNDSPPSFFLAYKKTCTTFIWKNNIPRIKYTRLTCPKTKGGIALSDLYIYYLACHLTRVVDWKVHKGGRPGSHWKASFRHIQYTSSPGSHRNIGPNPSRHTRLFTLHCWRSGKQLPPTTYPRNQAH